MNNELLLLSEEHSHTITEQKKTKTQETLEFKLNKQMETFLFHHQKTLLKKETDHW